MEAKTPVTISLNHIINLAVCTKDQTINISLLNTLLHFLADHVVNETRTTIEFYGPGTSELLALCKEKPEEKKIDIRDYRFESKQNHTLKPVPKITDRHPELVCCIRGEFFGPDSEQALSSIYANNKHKDDDNSYDDNDSMDSGKCISKMPCELPQKVDADFLKMWNIQTMTNRMVNTETSVAKLISTMNTVTSTTDKLSKYLEETTLVDLLKRLLQDHFEYLLCHCNPDSLTIMMNDVLNNQKQGLMKFLEERLKSIWDTLNNLLNFMDSMKGIQCRLDNAFSALKKLESNFHEAMTEIQDVLDTKFTEEESIPEPDLKGFIHDKFNELNDRINILIAPKKKSDQNQSTTNRISYAMDCASCRRPVPSSLDPSHPDKMTDLPSLFVVKENIVPHPAVPKSHTRGKLKRVTKLLAKSAPDIICNENKGNNQTNGWIDKQPFMRNCTVSSHPPMNSKANERTSSLKKSFVMLPGDNSIYKQNDNCMFKSSSGGCQCTLKWADQDTDNRPGNDQQMDSMKGRSYHDECVRKGGGFKFGN